MARKTKGTAPTAAPTPEAATIPPPETIRVRSHRVACDGVGGALGHPRVWLELGGAGEVDCPYCDRRFVAVTEPGDESELLAPGTYEGAAGH